jgi:hypothetical protein
MDINNYIGFVYLWLNTINGKKYIGAHVGKVDDGYVGSGKYFRKSIDKYGLKKFERKILYFEYESVENLWKKEFEIINENNAVKSNEYYNLCNTSPKMMKYIDGKIEKIVTEETKHKLSISAKNRKMSPETKIKMAKNSFNKNKKWYNNGKENKIFSINEQPNGWVLGRLKVSSGNKGYKTYNNGIEEKQFRTNEIPNGWVQGRLEKNIRSGTHNGFYGKKHSEDIGNKIMKTKLKNRTILYGERNPSSIKIRINNTTYGTITEAMRATGLTYNMVKKLGEEIL